MFGFSRGLRAVFVAAAVVFGLSGAVVAAPLEAYGRLPRIEDAQISPDGTLIAYAMTVGDGRVVAIKRVGEDKVIGGLRAGDIKIRNIQWAGSGFLIVTTSQTTRIRGAMSRRSEYMMAQTYDLATGRQQGLMDRAENSTNVILSLPRVRTIDGELTAVVDGHYFVDGVAWRGVFGVKVKSVAARLMDPGFANTDAWVVAADGQPLAETEYNEHTREWRLRIKSGGKWTTADSRTTSLDRAYLSGLGRDGSSVLVVDGDADGNRVLKEYPVAGGAPTIVDAPFGDLVFDPASDALIGTSQLVGDSYQYSFFDPATAAAWKTAIKPFGKDRVSLVSWSDNRRRIVVKVDSPIVGEAYALVDLDRKSADWLGEAYEGLTPADVSEVRAIAYKAKDGLEISGYLTVPRGKEAKGLPLVVLPHGGPASRDRPGFDWWAQALASRGYAVLQPNFRGSTGFGAQFLEAGYGEWGRKMQTDLSDGVRDLAAKGVVDPARVCIAGSSYGGYAALAGATLDKGVYRCAASIAGPSDLKRLISAEISLRGPSDTALSRYWSQFMGVDGRKDLDLAAISPALLADRADIPVLLIHGKDDTVVLYDQSQVMYDALRKAGKPVELVPLDGEDHNLSRGDTRLKMLTSLVAFLEKHNPPN